MKRVKIIALLLIMVMSCMLLLACGNKKIELIEKIEDDYGKICWFKYNVYEFISIGLAVCLAFDKKTNEVIEPQYVGYFDGFYADTTCTKGETVNTERLLKGTTLYFKVEIDAQALATYKYKIIISYITIQDKLDDKNNYQTDEYWLN